MKIQMNLLKTLLLLALAFAFAGCSGEPKIDASSPEALEKSMEAIHGTLTETQAEELAGAMMAIMMSEGALFADENKAEAVLMKHIDGKTVSEVIALGKKLAAGNQ